MAIFGLKKSSASNNKKTMSLSKKLADNRPKLLRDDFSSSSTTMSSSCSSLSLSDCDPAQESTPFQVSVTRRKPNRKGHLVSFDESKNVEYARPHTSLTLEECAMTWYSFKETRFMKEDTALSVAKRSDLYSAWRSLPPKKTNKGGNKRGSVVMSNKSSDPYFNAYETCCNGSMVSNEQIRLWREFLDDDATGLETLVLKHTVKNVDQDKTIRHKKMMDLVVGVHNKSKKTSHRRRSSSSFSVSSFRGDAKDQEQLSLLTRSDALFALAIGQLQQQQQ